MNAITIFQKIAMGGFNLMVSTFTNDLLVNAKQVNYFEMFLLSFIIELKNIVFPSNLSIIDLIDWEKIVMIKVSFKQFAMLNS
ncbi:hypothetical protein [uncultured Flavobacterium sp.]|uniref:hypothetical protein n=1 Tax=uncultured Flavobacterium sp. TaxID=165435 RepID=UPI0030C85B58